MILGYLGADFPAKDILLQLIEFEYESRYRLRIIIESCSQILY